MKTALLLIDIQRDYFPGGRYPLYEPERCATRAAQALTLFRESGLPVVHVRHISLDTGAPFFRPGTDGILIHPLVQPLDGETIIEKHVPDSFTQTPLHETLQALKVQRLVICGMMSHMCVDTTVRAARPLGYEVIVLGDACTTTALEWKGQRIGVQEVHGSFMAALDGSFASVIDTAALPETL